MYYSEFDDCLSCNLVYLETYDMSDSDDEPIEHELSKMLMLGQVHDPCPTSVNKVFNSNIYRCGHGIMVLVQHL